MRLSTGRERRGVGEGAAVLRFIRVALVFVASGARASNLRLDRRGDNGVGRLCEGRFCDGRLSGVKDSGRRLRCAGRGRALRLRMKGVVGVVGVGGSRGLTESSSSSSSSTSVPRESLDEEGLKDSRFAVLRKVPDPGGKEGLVAVGPVRDNLINGKGEHTEVKGRWKLWDFYLGVRRIPLALESPECVTPLLPDVFGRGDRRIGN